jgi:hypothetical protein
MAPQQTELEAEMKILPSSTKSEAFRIFLNVKNATLPTKNIFMEICKLYIKYSC